MFLAIFPYSYPKLTASDVAGGLRPLSASERPPSASDMAGGLRPLSAGERPLSAGEGPLSASERPLSTSEGPLPTSGTMSNDEALLEPAIVK